MPSVKHSSSSCMPDFFTPQYPRHRSLIANKRSYIAYIAVLYFCSLLCFIPFLTMVPGDDFVVHSSWLWCEGCINGRVTSHTISVLEMCLKHLKRKCSDMYFFLSIDGVHVSTNEFPYFHNGWINCRRTVYCA